MKMPDSNHPSNWSDSPWRFERATNTGVLFFAVVVMVYCAWTLNRGFEITDESYYLLLAIHAGTQKLYISAQHWITTWFWQITGSIAMFRASGMIVLLITSALLSLGTFSVCLRAGCVDDSLASKCVVVACSFVCAMLYASTINFSPCYNLLASAGAYTAMGMILLGSRRLNIIQKHMFYVFAGCAIGIEALCKASAGFSTLAIIILLLYVYENSYVYKISGAAAITLGAATFVGIALLANTTIADATQAVEQGIQLFKMVQAESVDARLIRYAIQFGQNIMATVAAFALPLLFFTVYAKTHRTIFAKLGFAILFVTLVFGGHFFGGWENGVSFAPPFAIVSMLIMALIVSTPLWKNDRDLAVLVGSLIFLPYSVAMGTGNTLFTQIIISLAPWGVLIGVLMVSRFPKNCSKIPVLFIGLCFIATVAVQIITSGFRPYHMSISLLKQDVEFTIPSLGVVKVDEETHKFLLDIKAAAKVCDILPGAPFLGLYNIPGVALALHANPVMSPWLNDVSQAEFVLDRSSPEELRSVVVALNMEDTGSLPALPQKLKLFPSDYKLCGTVTYPFRQQKIQIWRYSIL